MEEKQRKHIKSILLNWRGKCREEMVCLDSELALRNQDFEEMFNKLLNKFRKKKKK